MDSQRNDWASGATPMADQAEQATPGGRPGFFSESWCDLAWSPWAPFDWRHPLFSALPRGPGVYRVRPAAGRQLAYIGETGRSVRGRVSTLRAQCRSMIRTPLAPRSGLGAMRTA